MIGGDSLNLKQGEASERFPIPLVRVGAEPERQRNVRVGSHSIGAEACGSADWFPILHGARRSFVRFEKREMEELLDNGTKVSVFFVLPWVEGIKMG